MKTDGLDALLRALAWTPSRRGVLSYLSGLGVAGLLDNCQSDADCAGFGAGAFCVRKGGDICCFNVIPINQGFRALPCPT